MCKPGVEGPLSVIAYGAVVFDGEPAYDAIDGQWLTDEPYVLVHRIAVADGERGRGVAAEFLHRVEALASERGVKAFRIDTNFDNRTMLRLLERTGFSYCGKSSTEAENGWLMKNGSEHTDTKKQNPRLHSPGSFISLFSASLFS